MRGSISSRSILATVAVVTLKAWREVVKVLDGFCQVADGLVENNRFVIETNQPNVKVSWQVTGVRQDAYAEAHRTPVEEEKAADERGRYLHPDLCADEAVSAQAREPLGYRPSMFGRTESERRLEAEREAANWQRFLSSVAREPSDSAQ
jgi:hypothetical protein